MARVVRRSGPPSALLVDANALLLPFTQGVDLAEEVRRWNEGAVLLVPTSVREEIDRLVARGVPFAEPAAALAGRLRPVRSVGRGDEAIVELALRRGFGVVTADRALRDRLASAGVVVLVPRDRTRLTQFARRGKTTGRATVKRRIPLGGRSRISRGSDARRR